MQYNVTAIEREYASGGSEIGEKLAAKLGVPCYGQEILEKAAAKLNMPSRQLSELEENMTGSLLFSLVAFSNVVSGKEADFLNIEQKLAIAETEVIRVLAMNPCVIVGRGVSALLKDSNKALKVFIHADYNARIERAVNLYKVDSKNSESVIRNYDKRRANYFRATTGTEWRNPDIYHMLLNSTKLGIDSIVDILYTTVK